MRIPIVIYENYFLPLDKTVKSAHFSTNEKFIDILLKKDVKHNDEMEKNLKKFHQWKYKRYVYVVKEKISEYTTKYFLIERLNLYDQDDNFKYPGSIDVNKIEVSEHVRKNINPEDAFFYSGNSYLEKNGDITISLGENKEFDMSDVEAIHALKNVQYLASWLQYEIDTIDIDEIDNDEMKKAFVNVSSLEYNLKNVLFSRFSENRDHYYAIKFVRSGNEKKYDYAKIAKNENMDHPYRRLFYSRKEI